MNTKNTPHLVTRSSLPKYRAKVWWRDWALKVTNIVSKAGKWADSSYFCFKTKTIDASLQDIFEVHNRQKQIDL